MAVSAPGSAALSLRGVCKRYGTGQDTQVTAASNVTRARQLLAAAGRVRLG
jgi:hypothetical protein